MNSEMIELYLKSFSITEAHNPICDDCLEIYAVVDEKIASTE